MRSLSPQRTAGLAAPVLLGLAMALSAPTEG